MSYAGTRVAVVGVWSRGLERSEFAGAWLNRPPGTKVPAGGTTGSQTNLVYVRGIFRSSGGNRGYGHMGMGGSALEADHLSMLRPPEKVARIVWAAGRDHPAHDPARTFPMNDPSRVFVLRSVGPQLLGASAGCDFALEGAPSSIAPFHLCFRWTGDDVELSVHPDASPAHIEGEVVRQARIEHRAIVTIGGESFRIEFL